MENELFKYDNYTLIIKNGITIIRDKDGIIRDVELKTDKQRQAIDEKLEEFIGAYLEDANVRINEYKNLIKGVAVNEDTIREYMCNNFLIHNLYDMLLDFLITAIIKLEYLPELLN